MKVKNIIIKESDERPIFIRDAYEFTDGIKIINDPNHHIFKWTEINQLLHLRLTFDSNLTKSVKDNIILWYSKGFLAVEKDGNITILVLKTNCALYLNKSLENEHLDLYKRFKKSILALYEENLDIVQTNLVGKNILLTFEPPKFSSITERQEYGGKVLEKYLEEKNPKPKFVEEIPI